MKAKSKALKKYGHTGKTMKEIFESRSKAEKERDRKAFIRKSTRNGVFDPKL